MRNTKENTDEAKSAVFHFIIISYDKLLKQGGGRKEKKIKKKKEEEVESDCHGKQ